jgi:hypothetical protein
MYETNEFQLAPVSPDNGGVLDLVPLVPSNSIICPSPPDGSSIGVIVVGCVVAIILIILIILCVYFFLRRRRAVKRGPQFSNDSEGSASLDTRNRVAALEQELLELKNLPNSLEQKLLELERTVPDLREKLAELETVNAARNRGASDGWISLSPTTTHQPFPEGSASTPELGNNPGSPSLAELATGAAGQNGQLGQHGLWAPGARGHRNSGPDTGTTSP